MIHASFAARGALLLPLALLTQGCLVRTAVDVATAPVRVASKAVDLATTSQSEADEKRGRALRLHEERLGKLQRSLDQHRRDCGQGEAKACAAAEREEAEIERLLAAGPPRS